MVRVRESVKVTREAIGSEEGVEARVSYADPFSLADKSVGCANESLSGYLRISRMTYQRDH